MSSPSPIAETPSTTTEQPMSKDFNSYINDQRFNRTFQLPADSLQDRLGPLQVSYADFGFHHDPNDDTVQERVFLFFGPLMSSQLFHVAKDELAKRYKIRIIIAERPGIGKTDDVPANEMLKVWRGKLDAIAALLNHLRIKHVSIGCHSGGTVFALDFAFHNSRYLDPSQPYIAIGGPWIHPSHSGVWTYSLCASLPHSLIAQTDKMAVFINSTLSPILGVSAAISGSFLQIWPQTKPETGRKGPDVNFEVGMREHVAKCIFMGNVRGLGQETQVLLRNGAEKDGWSDWGDFDVLASRLAETVRQIANAPLRVDIFFAEKDNMVGDADTKGPLWFEKCWTNIDGIELRSETVKGTDHNCVWDLRWDVMEKVFKRMTEEP